MENTQQEMDDRHQQELSAARQNTKMEREKATIAEQEGQSISQANQELRTSHEGKVTEITNLTKQVDTLKHDLGKCQLQIQERDSRIVEKENTIESFETNNRELMSLRQTFDWINEEHSQCNAKLEKVTKQCEWLEDELEDLQPVTYQETSIQSGSQKSELEAHDSQPTEKSSTSTPAAGLLSGFWAVQVSTEASSLSEQEQHPLTVTAVTVEPMSETSHSVGKPTVNLPVPPSHAPKGPKGHPDYQFNNPTLVGYAGNHYRTENFLPEVPYSDASTTSDHLTYEFDENGKRLSFKKFYKNYMAERGGGIQDSRGRGRGHSSSGRGSHRPEGQRGGRGTNRGFNRGRGRGD